MNNEFEVIVVGGGVIGLTAALAMSKRGYRIAVIDAGTLDINIAKNDVRVYAINQASEFLLNELGVWNSIKQARFSPYQQMFVWDGTSGASISFDARTIAANKLGTIIEESIIKQALLQQIKQNHLITMFPEQLVKHIDVTQSLVHVSSASTSWQGQLLMIADGANSPSRQQLQIPIVTWPYHQHALIATVNTEQSHQHTAFQIFNPDGPLAFLPLMDAHQCSIVWSTHAERAQSLKMASNEEFNHQLAQAFHHKLGAVEVLSDRYHFPLTMRHTKQYVGKNWLLLGDAAHTIHPLAGLGLNIGFADLAVWLSYQSHANTLFTVKALLAYQRQRKHAVWQTIALMEAIKTLFANPLTAISLLRKVGLQVCDQLTPLKRLFIEHACSLSTRLI